MDRTHGQAALTGFRLMGALYRGHRQAAFSQIVIGSFSLTLFHQLLPKSWV